MSILVVYFDQLTFWFLPLFGFKQGDVTLVSVALMTANQLRLLAARVVCSIKLRLLLKHVHCPSDKLSHWALGLLLLRCIICSLFLETFIDFFPLVYTKTVFYSASESMTAIFCPATGYSCKEKERKIASVFSRNNCCNFSRSDFLFSDLPTNYLHGFFLFGFCRSED